MMRKLAVSVFVLSLAAFGCGSDNGTTDKTDTAVPLDGPGAKMDVKQDAPSTIPDAPSTPDMGKDMAPGSEVKPPVDVQPSEAGQLGEVGKTDVQPTVDVQTPDQGQTHLDGGTTTVDAGAVEEDAGEAIDTGSVG